MTRFSVVWVRSTFVAWALHLSMLCCGANAQQVAPAASVIGMGMVAYPPSTFSHPFTPGVYYGALRVQAEFDQDFKLLKGDRARSLLDRLKAVFGKEVTSFAITVDVTLPQGTKMPTVYALVASYDSSENRWKTAIAEQYTMTPWVYLDASRSFRYTIKYVASERSDVLVFSNALNVVGQIAELFPAAWALNATATASIDKIGREFERRASAAFFNKSYEAEALTEVNPYAGLWSGRTYVFSDFRDRAIGKISVLTWLKQSLVVGEETREIDETPELPDFSFSNPRETLQSLNHEARKLDTELRSEAFYSSLTAPSDVSQFAKACQNFNTWLIGKGLNNFDKTAFAYKVLTADTRFKDQAYRDVCFRESHELFAKLFPKEGGIDVPTCVGGGLGSAYADLLGGWWVGGAGKSAPNVVACLAKVVTINWKPKDEFVGLAAEDVAAELSKILGSHQAAGARTYSANTVRGGAAAKSSVTWCLDSKPRYQFELSSRPDKGGLVDRIVVREGDALAGASC